MHPGLAVCKTWVLYSQYDDWENHSLSGRSGMCTWDKHAPSTCNDYCNQHGNCETTGLVVVLVCVLGTNMHPALAVVTMVIMAIARP